MFKLHFAETQGSLRKKTAQAYDKYSKPVLLSS